MPQGGGFQGTPGGGYGFTPDPNILSNLNRFVAPVPKEMEQLGSAAGTEMQRAQGAQPMATFSDMFNRYVDVSNREAARNAAQIKESMGSMGARYGSDILRQQADLRQRQTQDIMNQAGNFTLGLEQSRQGLLNIAGQGLSDVGGAKYASWTGGVGNMYQDYLRNAAPSPILGPAASVPTSYGPGSTVAY